MAAIRTARPSDAAALADLEALCFSDPWSEAAILGQLTGEATISLLAEEAGQVVGALFLSCLPPEGEVYRLAVRPERRRAGLGRALLCAGLERERKAGVRHLYLDVRAGNAAALALYRAFGFSVCGRRAGYYRAPREDAILMERELFTDEIFGH